jgi:hypothetical protein
MEPYNFCAHAVETKMSSKICAMQWKITRSIIIIGSTLKTWSACMRLHVWTWPSGWAEFLCYCYEQFMLFAEKKENNNLWLMSHVGVRYGLIDARGEVWPGAWQRDMSDALTACVWSLGADQGWLGLPELLEAMCSQYTELLYICIYSPGLCLIIGSPDHLPTRCTDYTGPLFGLLYLTAYAKL